MTVLPVVGTQERGPPCMKFISVAGDDTLRGLSVYHWAQLYMIVEGSREKLSTAIII